MYEFWSSKQFILNTFNNIVDRQPRIHCKVQIRTGQLCNNTIYYVMVTDWYHIAIALNCGSIKALANVGNCPQVHKFVIQYVSYSMVNMFVLL